jgi:hypothetical protein
MFHLPRPLIPVYHSDGTVAVDPCDVSDEEEPLLYAIVESVGGNLDRPRTPLAGEGRGEEYTNYKAHQQSELIYYETKDDALYIVPVAAIKDPCVAVPDMKLVEGTTDTMNAGSCWMFLLPRKDWFGILIELARKDRIFQRGR